jgi:hypothetical protein
VANYSDNLAGLRIDNIALEHVFLFSVLRVRCDVYNSEFGALFRFGAIVRGCREMARSRCQMSSLRRSRLSASRANRQGATVWRRLVEEYGDAKLTDLLQTLASCPKTRSASIHDQCKGAHGWLAPTLLLADGTEEVR